MSDIQMTYHEWPWTPCDWMIQPESWHWKANQVLEWNLICWNNIAQSSTQTHTHLIRSSASVISAMGLANADKVEHWRKLVDLTDAHSGQRSTCAHNWLSFLEPINLYGWVSLGHRTQHIVALLFVQRARKVKLVNFRSNCVNLKRGR